MENAAAVLPDEVPADAVVLDVREQGEWAAGHIAGARLVPMGEIPGRLGEVAAMADDAPGGLVVACRSGARSARVVAWLARNGVDAVNLEGGTIAWAETGRPLVSDTGREPFVR